MSRAEELREEEDLARWWSDQLLFTDTLRYVLARAPKCTRGACCRVAYWRSVQRDSVPKEELLCDMHRSEGTTAIEGSEVLRRIVSRARP